MTTLPDRPNSALLVTDVQNGVIVNAYERDRGVANIAALVEKARAAGAGVVWIQHNNDELQRGGEAWQLVLAPSDAEAVVQKAYADAFEETMLEAVLAERKVGRLLVAGAQTDECIRATLHGAIVRGYDATLVGDAHTTEDLSEWGAPPPAKVIEHTNLYWGNHQAPGRTAGTVAAADVEF